MRSIVGINKGSYTFDASAKTVTIDGYGAVLREEQVLIINHLPSRQSIYSPLELGKGGTFAGKVLTLEFDTTDFDDADELQIILEEGVNFTSQKNSTNTILLAGQTFTGDWEHIGENAELIVFPFADVDSAVNGVKVQWSHNGVDVHDNSDAWTMKGSNGSPYTFGTQPEFFRVIYENGSTNQAEFSLRSMLRRNTGKHSSHVLGRTITMESDATLTKSVMTGFDENGHSRLASVSSRGAQLIEDASLGTPPDTVSVEREAYSNVAGTPQNLFYTITNGKVLTVQRLSGSMEASPDGSVVELWEDQNGDLSVLNIISVINGSGSVGEKIINKPFLGNGTRRILMRRRNLGGGSAEIFGSWKGFEL